MDQVPNVSQPAAYRVRIVGRVDNGWSDFMSSLEESCDQENGVTITTISGVVTDQAVLHGLLERIKICPVHIRVECWGRMLNPIPNTHIDLFQNPIHGVLTTLMSDGMPQSSIVWVDYDGEYVLINTTLERQKGRNMHANPKVTVLVIDPRDSSRWVEVRGQIIEFTRDGAESHADKLTQRYCPANNISTGIFIPSNRRKEKRA